MSVSDQDLELLDALLDGELADAEVAAMRQRLGSDPQLSAALQRLRDQRDLREQAFRACEPTDAEVAGLANAVRSSLQRDQLWSRRTRALRYVSALAACLTFGFLMGRFIPHGPTAPEGNGIVFDLAPGPMQEVGYRPSGGQFRVLLTDANGRVIAEQPFDTLDEAREFTDDLSRLQGPQPVRPTRVSETIYTRGQF